jgi:hypothetical protein
MADYRTHNPKGIPEHKIYVPINKDILSDHHLSGIGLLITQWAFSESILRCAICDLQTLKSGAYLKDDVLLSPLMGMRGEGLIGILRAIGKVRFKPELSADLEKMLNRFKYFLELRDLISHSMWQDDPNGVEGIAESFRGKGRGTINADKRRYSAIGLHLEAYLLWLLTCELIRFFKRQEFLLEYPVPGSP